MAEDSLLGGYRRVNIMQTGQNSEVWEVTDVSGRQRFAMKLLLPERMMERDQIALLRHEAAVAMKLEHPKIIRFFHLKCDRKHWFILMEFFPSMNLKLRLMRKNSFEEFIKPKTRMILDQVFQAVHYMHEKRWVHRDLKPDNVLVNSMGDVRLIDFALAVREATSFSHWFARRRSIAGTRSYMSPEQILGRPLDRRSDIYSLGVMIFEMVSGRLPFIAASGQELLKKHLFNTAPPVDPSRNVTPEFESLIQRMLAKKPANRPPNLLEIQSELRKIRIYKDEQLDENNVPGMTG